MSELTVTVDRNPKAAPEDNLAEQIRSKRAEVHAKYDEIEAIKAPPPVDDTIEPVEDLDSVELDLPNGMRVEFGPPSGISLSMRIIRLLGEQSSNSLAVGILRILMCVRSINGAPVAPITTQIDADKMANRIGDDGIDILSTVYAQYWKPVRQNDLKLIKKNLRR